MLRYEKTLNELPIPSLNETLEKYLSWVKPILSNSDFEKTKLVVEEFGKKGGEGEKLQKKLLQYKENIEGNKSWLFPMWDEMYLGIRYSIIPGVSFCALLNNDKYKDKYTLEEILSNIAFAATGIYHQIVDGTFPIDMIIGNPLCMELYLRVFKSMRIADSNIDKYHVGDLSKEANYCIIFNKNNIYKVMLSDKNGLRIHPQNINKAIELITKNNEEKAHNPFIYTCSEREDAKKILDKILVSEENLKNFEEVKDALFVMCIDDSNKDQKETVYDLLLSNGDNRCFDKSLQFIINRNKEIGASIEHTGFDGSIIFGLLEIINNELENGPNIIDISSQHILSEKIEFILTDETKKLLDGAKKEQIKRLQEYYLNLQYFNDFGSAKIKELKISPDAYFHIAVQVAQYKTFGKIRSTYEPVSVRNFRQGRTECARSSSLEKLEFAKAFNENKLEKEAIYELLEKASNAHVSRIKECQAGHGVERHLFGLAQMQSKFAQELNMQELPDIFKDKGYIELKTDFISTSGVGGKAIRYCAFGPQVEEGVGMFYTMNKDNIVINLSSKVSEKEKADEFVNNLILAFREIRKFIEELKK